jgi:dTDP-glucose pyrophosphorylase
MMNVIITMAGNGRRFREAGYDCPKYEIQAHGKTLFEWSMRSLDHFWQAGAHAVFVTQREHEAESFIQALAPQCGISQAKVIEVSGVTDGQATSALLAGPAIQDKTAPVVIFNIDTYVDPAYLHPEDIVGQGWIPCFPGKGDGWSFAKVDKDNRVIELREKVRISEWATIGLYHFGSFALYEQLYAEHFAHAEGMEKGERYIAPMYNSLIKRGDAFPVHIAQLPHESVIPMGTPAELTQFLAMQPPGGEAAC